MNIGETLNKKGDKIHFYYDLGRGPGQRPTAGIFIYANLMVRNRRISTRKRLKFWKQRKAS